ncbi:MAG: M14-type cytosolic carboxypeptidase [Pirellulales bacterium]
MDQRAPQLSSRSFATIALAIIIAAVSTPHCAAAIALDADFDSGSLCLAPSGACDDAGVASSVSGNNVSLVGRDNFSNNQWKWIYFRAAGVGGQTVNFEIGDDFDVGSSSLVGHKFVYSYDQEHWTFFDNNQLIPSQDKFVFSNNTPFNQDQVYVAYGLPYPYQRVVDQTAELAANPWVSPTASGSPALVVGNSPGGTDDIGRAIAPHNLYGFRITDGDSQAPKKKIVLSSGVHANETVGNWTLEGLVNFLVSDDLAAAQLRRYADFYVYPMVNPDGRYAGNNRTTVQVGDVDPNRAWNPPSYTEPGDTSTLVDIARVGNAMRVDTGQDIDYLVDFHSTVNHELPYHYGYILPAWQSNPFWQAVLAREPTLITASASLVDFTLAKFGRDVLNAEFSATFETLFIADENVDRYLSLGRNFGLAWRDVLVVAGDLNFDGALNGQDYLALAAHSETDLAPFSAIERYERGDLDGDGLNTISDFVLFKSIYEEAHGAAAFEAMLQTVPEPGTACLGLCYGMTLSATAARFARRTFWTNSMVA